MPSDFANETLHVTKFSLINHGSHEKFLRMSDYQASSKPRSCFVFYNNVPQSKAVTVNNKRKIFSFLTRPS